MNKQEYERKIKQRSKVMITLEVDVEGGNDSGIPGMLRRIAGMVEVDHANRSTWDDQWVNSVQVRKIEATPLPLMWRGPAAEEPEAE